jgi:alpha-L-rhamnosidase
LWGVRGNYRSIPTDCPQRDERQGWLGDRSEESKGESYLYDIMPFYAKWMTDIQDSQRADGCVPDVAPAYWTLYNDGVTWPSSFLIIPGTLYDQYGDLSVIAKHYDAMKKWITHMNEYMQDGLMPRDTYGDWCVPPEGPHLIHSQDPARQTNGTLIGTAYYIHDLDLMARYANLLGKPDANDFLKQAASMKAAFNRVFFKPENGYYDNGTQTSCVLALAFDLVPKEYKEKVLNRLLEKIEVETKDHIGTGLIGGQWLMRTLTKNGHSDLAVQLALNKTYPSWGYMVENGATTIWELWNGNTADPAMNSGNHVMLIGDLNTWLYEYLGGIRALEPGFREILLDPIQPEKIHSADVKWNSPYGAIVSNWKREANTYIWDVTVPANTTAEVRIPAKSEDGVTEGGKPIASARGIRFLRMEKNRAILEVESGSYRFQSSL